METISLSFKSTLRDCKLRSWAFLVQHSDCPEKPGTIASAMYEYASYCPVAATTSVVGDYWTPLIVRELLYGTVRFNQLARNLPSISRSLLSDRLRKLERAGVVECQREGRNVTSYSVTPAGRGLQAVIDAMNEWGTRWGHRDANPQALDPVLTICMMKDRMRVEELPDSRVVVEVVSKGEGEGRAWLVCEGHGVAMCFDPPGLDVDLWVKAKAQTLYDVWLQGTTMSLALKRGDVNVDGPPLLVRSFVRWFDGADSPPAVRD